MLSFLIYYSNLWLHFNMPFHFSHVWITRFHVICYHSYLQAKDLILIYVPQNLICWTIKIIFFCKRSSKIRFVQYYDPHYRAWPPSLFFAVVFVSIPFTKFISIHFHFNFLILCSFPRRNLHSIQWNSQLNWCLPALWPYLRWIQWNSPTQK